MLNSQCRTFDAIEMQPHTERNYSWLSSSGPSFFQLPFPISTSVLKKKIQIPQEKFEVAKDSWHFFSELIAIFLVIITFL